VTRTRRGSFRSNHAPVKRGSGPIVRSSRRSHADLAHGNERIECRALIWYSLVGFSVRARATVIESLVCNPWIRLFSIEATI